jgi:hypothetical protein
MLRQARQPTRNVGTDLVTLQDDHLQVVSRVDMADWEVRRHRPSLIRFDGRTWRIARKTPGAGETFEYTLVPWRPDDQHLIGPEIEYGPAYVAHRDLAIGTGRRRRRFVLLVRMAAPLAGFLPAHTKARLEVAFGLDPMAATFQSVFVEFLIAFVAVALVGLALLEWRAAVDPLVLIAIVCGTDGGVRWDRILSEQRPPPGFYEWLFGRGGARRR